MINYIYNVEVSSENILFLENTFYKYYSYLEEYISNKIISVSIENLDENHSYYGSVNTKKSGDNFFFEIIYCDEIFKFDKLRTEAIIAHEIIHCYEIYTSSINYKDYVKYIRTTVVESTKSMLLHIAVQQWSEYYSHSNSSKIVPTEIDNLYTLINKNEEYLLACKNVSIKTKDAIMPLDEWYKSFDSFIKRSVILIAVINQSKHYRLINTYIDNHKHYRYYEYIIELIYKFNCIYSNYPISITEDNLLDLGKSLYSFVKYFGLEFTEDLSLKYIGE